MGITNTYDSSCTSTLLLRGVEVKMPLAHGMFKTAARVQADPAADQFRSTSLTSPCAAVQGHAPGRYACPHLIMTQSNEARSTACQGRRAGAAGSGQVPVVSQPNEPRVSELTEAATRDLAYFIDNLNLDPPDLEHTPCFWFAV